MTNNRVMGDKKGDMGDKKGDMGDKKGDIGRHGNNCRHLRIQKRRHWETHKRDDI
jgi:hypothetical protein